MLFAESSKNNETSRYNENSMNLSEGTEQRNFIEVYHI